MPPAKKTAQHHSTARSRWADLPNQQIGFLSNSMMIKARNTIMKHRIIDRIVDVTVQRQVPTVQTVLQTVENLQVQFLDRVVDMPFVTQQKRSPARLCFSLASRQRRSVTRGACDCSLKETQ